MKHIFVLFVISILAFSFIGCGTASKGDDMVSTPLEDNTEISGNTNNAGIKHSLSNYYIESTFMYFDSIEAGPTGKFWIQGYREDDQQHENEIYIAVDKDLNILYILEADDYSPRSKIYDNIAVVFDKKQLKNIVLDDMGNDITHEYADIDNGESFIELSEDITGITLWTIQDEDTYDKHITTLYAKDDSGNIKQSWSSDKFNLYFNELIYNDGTGKTKFTFSDKGIYRFGNSVINLLSGNAFQFENDAIIGVDNEKFIYTRDGGMVFKYTDQGEEILESVGLRGKSQAIGAYSEGLIYVRGECDGEYLNGFIDTNGNYVLDLPVEATNEPIFENGYAVIECKNSGGVTFVTLVDKQGNMLFEPIRGFYVDTVMIASEKCYLIGIGSERMILNLDGSTSNVPQIWNSSYVYFDEKYYVAENGEVVQYDTTSWKI